MKLNFWGILLFGFILVVISMGGCEYVLEPEDPDFSHLFRGNWIGIYDEVQSGSADEDCDAIYFVVDRSKFTMIFFYNGSQITGAKGSFTAGDEKNFVMNISHYWMKGNNWESFTHVVKTLNYSFSSDSSRLILTDPAFAGDFVMDVKKCTLSLPENIVGEWSGDGINFILQETGHFTWSMPDSSFAGTGKNLGEVGGRSYLLLNITECSSETGDSCNVYMLYEYERNTGGDELTVRVGGETFVLRLS